jgi:hypothetical protein
MRDILEAKVGAILDIMGVELTNTQLADLADHLNAMVDLACEQAQNTKPGLTLNDARTIADSIAVALDPVLEMSLRVSTMLDAIQRQASKS